MAIVFLVNIGTDSTLEVQRGPIASRVGYIPELLEGGPYRPL